MTREEARKHLRRWMIPVRIMTVTASLVVLFPVFAGLALEVTGLVDSTGWNTPQWYKDFAGLVALFCFVFVMIGWGIGVYHISLAQRHGFVSSWNRSGRFMIDLNR